MPGLLLVLAAVQAGLPPPRTTVLWNGFLFDGTGSESVPGSLVLEGGRIVAILPEGETGWPRGAMVLDVSGHTVLPGLIDIEARSSGDPVAFLGAGITSVRFDKEVESGISGPRVFAPGPGPRESGVGTGASPEEVVRAYVLELEALVEAGLSEAGALRAATLDGARVLGVDDRLGSLEVGKLADILVVEGDPLTQIGAIANVAEVFRGGYWVVRRGRVEP